MFFRYVLEKQKHRKKVLANDKAQFIAVSYPKAFTIQMQKKTVEDCTEQELIECMEEMLEAPKAKNEFIVLTAPKPQKGIAYIQACMVDDWIETEIGVEHGKQISLLYKMCTRREYRNLFLAFYQYPINPKGLSVDITEFVPVPF